LLTSCGVLVTDRRSVLLGHATRSPRWDIPKGLAESGEALLDAAARELAEETGLAVSPNLLIDLGIHRYLPAKQLALFTWITSPLPDPATLTCVSTFVARDGTVLPEFDRFALFPWDEALTRVGKNMARVLAGLRAHPHLASPIKGEE
jgi:8-oxo-dGTP pyrophosphatase MutT (NUDIX family)